MSDTPLTTEERLYSLSKQKLWDHVSEEQHRYMLESEAYDLWLVATESCREEIQKALQKGITSVIFLRCKKHYNIPVQNKNEFSGGECGGCIAEQRDALRDRVTELEKALAFYANEDSWIDQGFPDGDYLSLAYVDAGKEAKAAIAAQKGKDEIQRAQG